MVPDLKISKKVDMFTDLHDVIFSTFPLDENAVKGGPVQNDQLWILDGLRWFSTSYSQKNMDKHNFPKFPLLDFGIFPGGP